ncbi:MAG TPA: hypothetical protein VMP01_23975, partial [Pirellulaceae bacterium]|nr:hypothetical protein [Pirellulaceae bacterium]
MLRWFTVLLLAVAASAVGCGMTGESTLDAMKRRAQARADSARQEEEQSKQRIAKAAAAYAALKGQSLTDDESEVAVVPANTPQSQAKPAAAKSPAGSAAAGAENTAASPAKFKLAAIRPPVPSKPETPLTDIQRRNKSAANLDQIIKAL